MPKVRASSGTIGTMSLPISWSLSILRSMPTKAMVVETSLPSLPSRNSLKSSSWSATSGFARTLRWHEATQRFAPSPQILNIRAVFRGPVKRQLDAVFVVQRNAKAGAELAQFVFVEFLLLVRNVLALARFAQAVTLDRTRQNHRRRTL